MHANAQGSRPTVGRIGRGWQLTKESWVVVRRDRSLMVFPVVAGIAGLVVVAIFGGAGAALYLGADSEPAAIVVLVIGAYVLVALSIFCNVALTACATRSLEGVDTQPGEGFAAARARLGPIFAWAGLQLVVGALINLLQAFLREGAGQLIAAVAGSLANLAWSVATFFVIPVIALEGLGPREALKRSLSVIRERWGEGVTGSFAIGGLIFVIAFLPGAVLVGIGVSLTASSDALAALLIATGVLVFVTGAVIQTALIAIFKVALYRFATEDRVLADFDRQTLNASFRPRRSRRATI
jgi:Family of unknown function (DUF6159)